MFKSQYAGYRSILNQFCFCMIIGLLTLACTESQTKEVRTKHGYKIEFLRDLDGETANADEVFLYDMKVFANDSMLHTTYGQEPPPFFKWMSEEKLANTNSPILDALEIMTAGDSALVYHPADSLQGNKFGLSSGEFLIYELSIHDIISSASFDSMAQALNKISTERETEVAGIVNEDIAAYKTGQLDDKLVKHESGLEYLIHEKGTGEIPAVESEVSVHYYGALLSDGTMFDNSIGQGRAFKFRLGTGMVIPGWDVGIGELPKGSKATLFIPYEMAYGASGRPPQIPEKANLVFYVELQDK